MKRRQQQVARRAHATARKIALWTLAIPAALCLLLILALAVGGWWVESVYLRGTIRFGENGAQSVRAHGARFQWLRLNFGADSVWYRSPSLDARAGKTEIGIDWIGGLLALRPAARLDADSLFVRLRADTADHDTLVLDSMAFPDIAVPLAVRIGVRGIRVDDDSGRMAEARGVTLRTRGGKAARARIGRAETRWTGDLALGASAGLDWSDPDSVDLRAEVHRSRRGQKDPEDQIRIQGRHARLPLWKGRDSLEADIRDAAPYLAAFRLRDLDSALPDVREIRLRASAALGDSLDFGLRLAAGTGAHRFSPDFALGPQAVDLRATWKRDHGDLAFRSAGTQGEDVRLDANARRIAATGPWWERMGVSLRGHATGLKVRVRDTLRTADARIEKADWNGRDLSLSIVTGDSSRLTASGTPGKPARGEKGPAFNARNARGTFAVRLNPGERWLKVFLGETISFTALDARGDYGNQRLTAVVAARGVRAYGFQLDSVRSFHEYGPGGYVLKPSRLYADGKRRTLWMLSGTVTPARGKQAGTDLAFALENAEHGKLTYALDADGTMTAKASLFAAGALPYPALDSLPVEDPLIDGIFAWNPDRKTGHADVSAQARFRKRDIEARVTGKWDARRLDLANASVKMGKSELGVAARMRLNGRQFYEAYKVKPAQYEQAEIRTPGFDIAEALGLFQAEPALSKGSVSGELKYGEASGFEGQLTFSSITPADAIGDVTLKQLDIEGMGDTLFLSARTTSETIKPLNATLRVGVSALLRDEQKIRLDLVAGDSLRVRLTASSRQFQSLRGDLRATGGVALPEKSGALEKIDLDASFDVPLTDPLNRSTLTTRAFTGVYVLPGMRRQAFSLDPALREGVFRMSRFSLRNDQGQVLSGNMEYQLAKGSLKLHLGGERFMAQWADDYSADLRGLNLDLARDATGLRIDADFSRGTFLFVDAPLHARGTLTGTRIRYDVPARPKAAAGRQRHEQEPAVLTFTGSLSESLIRYRLKTFSDLQKVFRKERQRKSSGPPLRLNVKVQALGNQNQIDSDILRLTWVGDLSVRGVHPYTLFNGRVNALDGGLGLDKQAYDMRRFEVKWLNAPMEEGRINMEARKELASDCSRRDDSRVDSCTVITRLQGELGDMRFSYDSDCGGSYGAGASVAAILYSVQRGCYDASLATGEGGDYGAKALTLIESPLNNRLSTWVGRYSRNWIEATEVTGLGSLSGEADPAGDSLGEALSLGLTSKEYMRLRLKVRSGRHVASQDLSNPWEHMLALEWRPPADYLFRDEAWKRRMRDNLRAVASLQTRPVRINNPEEDEVEKKIGLNYTYFFWGNWWSKPRKPEETVTPPLRPAQASGEPIP